MLILVGSSLLLFKLDPEGDDCATAIVGILWCPDRRERTEKGRVRLIASHCVFAAGTVSTRWYEQLSRHRIAILSGEREHRTSKRGKDYAQKT